jgi:glutamate synthase domain-containing protein 1
MARQNVVLPPVGMYGVGMVFLPRGDASRRSCEAVIERAIRYEGQVLLGWRDVPVDNSGLAQAAKDIEPVIRQVFIAPGPGITDTDALERKLYILRKAIGHSIQAQKLPDGKMFYVPSMSGAHGGLQGHAAGQSGGHLLSRFAGQARGVGHGAGAPAFSPPTPSRPGTWPILSA